MSKRNELLKRIRDRLMIMSDETSRVLCLAIEEELETVDLTYVSMAQLEQAVAESNWIPKEYYDWISDCCRFLKEGPETFMPNKEPVAEVVYVEEYKQSALVANGQRLDDFPVGTKFYTSPPQYDQEFINICKEEIVHVTLTSYPLKIAFAKERGMNDIDEVHDWMNETRRKFEEAIKNLEGK